MDILLLIVLIFQICIFFIRKKLVGEHLCKIKSSNFRLISLIPGIIMFYIAIVTLQLAVELDDFSNYLSICGSFVIGLLSFNIYFFSNIFIGVKGVSFSIIPFFISNDKIKYIYIKKNNLIIQKINSKNIILDINNNNPEFIENILSKINNKQI